MRAIKTMLLLLLPFFLIRCIDCGEKLPEQIGPFQLAAEGKSYIKFTPGTWWVYKNTKTKALDTIIYDGYTEKMLHFKGNRYEYDREHIQFNMHSKTWGYTQRCETGHPYVDVTNAKYYNTLYSVDKSQSDLWGASFVGQVRFYKYPFDTIKNTGEGTDIHLHPTFTVQGQTYQNVVEFEIFQDGTWRDGVGDSWHTSYFWAPKTGIVRRAKYQSISNKEINYAWELIAFHPNP
jgi:hypothetical protein